MVCKASKASPVYRSRRPRQSPLYRLIERYWPEFKRTYRQRYQKRYGPWRPIIDEVIRKFLTCGDLHFGFARVRCKECHHEMLAPFSCRQRCLCPSCHQKRTLLAADTIAHTICLAVPHRQLVFTIPKRLRLFFRFDRRLLGDLARAAWETVAEVYREVLGREDALPGMIAGIQSFGQLVHWNAHIHAIVTDGCFAPDGTFICLPRIDTDRLLKAWEPKVFEFLLAAGKIDDRTVAEMRSWEYSGFSVDNSVTLSPGDTFGLERLAQYILRCPFSLARIIRLTEDGSVVYRAEKEHCHRFPGAASRDLRGGPSRNFQVFNALDFLAELTQHIPEKNEHLVRFYGWYSHRQRGIRAKAEQVGQVEYPEDGPTIDRSAIDAEKSASDRPRAGSVSTWAMLIKRIYEVDPLQCAKCGGEMKIISFIERDQRLVIEKILRHCDLWEGPIRTLANSRGPPSSSERAPDEPRELQLVLDPEFL
ncbi:MAG: transposase [Verrucomicrobia bacterium]|nr:transposase [Verrucomicrobiota bacterium]